MKYWPIWPGHEAMDNIATLTTAIVRYFLEWNLVEKGWHAGGSKAFVGAEIKECLTWNSHFTIKFLIKSSLEGRFLKLSELVLSCIFPIIMQSNVKLFFCYTTSIILHNIIDRLTNKLETSQKLLKQVFFTQGPKKGTPWQ